MGSSCRPLDCFRPSGHLLAHYAENLLDSLLSLSRFTSLVRWRYASASYRPMRIARNEQPPGPSVVLRRGPSPSDPEILESDYLWTGASDGTFAVGWIVRKFLQDYENKSEFDDPVQPDTPPWVHITGLSQIPLELAWFDDHTGCLIGNPEYSPDGSFVVQAPPTIQGGFGKSVAFLIQPVGFTPSKSFEPLPNHMIGQIVLGLVEPRHPQDRWHEEHADVHFIGEQPRDLTFVAKTKPSLSSPGLYKYNWYLYNPSEEPRDRADAGPQITERFEFGDGGTWSVTLTITDLQGKRMTGDILYVEIHAPHNP